jgi:hypothetical protein
VRVCVRVRVRVRVGVGVGVGVQIRSEEQHNDALEALLEKEREPVRPQPASDQCIGQVSSLAKLAFL